MLPWCWWLWVCRQAMTLAGPWLSLNLLLPVMCISGLMAVPDSYEFVLKLLDWCIFLLLHNLFSNICWCLQLIVDCINMLQTGIRKDWDIIYGSVSNEILQLGEIIHLHFSLFSISRSEMCQSLQLCTSKNLKIVFIFVWSSCDFVFLHCLCW